MTCTFFFAFAFAFAMSFLVFSHVFLLFKNEITQKTQTKDSLEKSAGRLRVRLAQAGSHVLRTRPSCSRRHVRLWTERLILRYVTAPGTRKEASPQNPYQWSMAFRIMTRYSPLYIFLLFTITNRYIVFGG